MEPFTTTVAGGAGEGVGGGGGSGLGGLQQVSAKSEDAWVAFFFVSLGRGGGVIGSSSRGMSSDAYRNPRRERSPLRVIPAKPLTLTNTSPKNVFSATTAVFKRYLNPDS